MNGDQMCFQALKRGYLKVDSRKGIAFAVRNAAKPVGCLNSKGYKVFTLHLDGGRSQIKLHRLIWIAANGIPSKEKCIDHINGIKNDNRLSNLRLVSVKENNLNRRSYNGEENPSAKITKEKADSIRLSHPLLRSYKKVVEKFGVSRSLVAQIVRRELWIYLLIIMTQR